MTAKETTADLSGTTLSICGLIHESNAFADTPTHLDDFMRFDAEAMRLIAPSSGTEVGGAILESDAMGALTEPTSVAMALSSGPVDDAAAATLVNDLVDGLASVGCDGPDAVVACLHGSMCSPTDPDVEGTVLARIRAQVGQSVPIVATLDWHASVTEQMVESTDAIISYRTYPHVDQEDRGREAARLALELTRSDSPVASTWIPVPMMIAGPATRDDHPAMRSVLDQAVELAAEDSRIVTWSVIPGFARSDTPWSGSHVYVAATDPRASRAMAETLAGALWGMRASFEAELVAVNEAVERALTATRQRGGPVVLSDQGDNPGGGAPGDATALLEALEHRGAQGALVASLHSPGTVSACHDHGIGAMAPLRVSTTEIEVTVEAVSDGRYVIRAPTHPNVPFDIGPAALVRTPGGVGVIVTSTPVQNEDLQLFDLFAVNPTEVPVLVVKSNAHFRAAFEPIATEVIDVDTPGISTPHLERLPYQQVRRPIWPLDRDMQWNPHE